MLKKVLCTFGIFLVITAGFSTGFTISEKIADNKNSSKTKLVKTVKENFIENPLKNINNISFKPKIDTEEKFIEEKDKKEEKKVTKKTFYCPTPKIEYEDMFLREVDQNYGLSDFDYIPKDLEKVSTSYSTREDICLIKEARENFEKMAEQAKYEGYNIKVSSGFRDYNTQKYLLENEINIGNPNAEIAVAKAGYSEHQLGTAIDVTGQSILYDSASKKFNDTKEASWMKENAWEYGFVMSYPLGKEISTGYQYEPWHYRYVGLDIAKKVTESDKSLNEYLKSLKR